MIVVDLNDYDESLSCGDIARQLAQSGKYHADTPLRFMRGNTKVFKEDLKLVYWIDTRIKESTDGEWMKTVRYVPGCIHPRGPTYPPDEYIV